MRKASLLPRPVSSINRGRAALLHDGEMSTARFQSDGVIPEKKTSRRDSSRSYRQKRDSVYRDIICMSSARHGTQFELLRLDRDQRGLKSSSVAQLVCVLLCAVIRPMRRRCCTQAGFSRHSAERAHSGISCSSTKLSFARTISVHGDDAVGQGCRKGERRCRAAIDNGVARIEPISGSWSDAPIARASHSGLLAVAASLPYPWSSSNRLSTSHSCRLVSVTPSGTVTATRRDYRAPRVRPGTDIRVAG